jgi:hypothetical protein
MQPSTSNAGVERGLSGSKEQCRKKSILRASEVEILLVRASVLA